MPTSGSARRRELALNLGAFVLAFLASSTHNAPHNVSLVLTCVSPRRLTQQSSAARAVGTTVAVANIFQPLPVRRRELERNIKREYAKLILALQVRPLTIQGWGTLPPLTCCIAESHFRPSTIVLLRKEPNG